MFDRIFKHQEQLNPLVFNCSTAEVYNLKSSEAVLNGFTVSRLIKWMESPL